MKKLYFILLLLISQYSFSQSWGTQIGQTYYDLHSKGSHQNNIARNSDGSISVVWSEHWDHLDSNNSPKNILGIGYNHYNENDGWIYGTNGECWEEDFGCASEFSKSPQIINLESANSNGKQEIILTDRPLKINERNNIGSGNWSNTFELQIDQSYLNGLEYIKAISSDNYIHIIGLALDTNGIDSIPTLRYFRSNDGGVSYDIQGDTFAFLPIYVENISEDGYAIHANGNYVSITLGNGINNDWIVYISNDYGYTWNEKLIKDNHNFDTTIINNDTLTLLNENNFDILIDNDGTTHVFATTNVYNLNTKTWHTNSQIFKKMNGGIYYWNSDLPEDTTILAATPDYAQDGDTSNYNVYIGTHDGENPMRSPAACFDNNGGIYLIYSALMEGEYYFLDPDLDPQYADTLSFHDLYLVSSVNNGMSWGEVYEDGGCCCYIYTNNIKPINLANYIMDSNWDMGTPIEDEIFPTCIKEISEDSLIHFTWQIDYLEPGLALNNPNHRNDIQNFIQYSQISTQSTLLGKQSLSNLNEKNTNGTDCTGIIEYKNNIKISIHPNPSNEFTTIESTFKIEEVGIFNSLGQSIESIRNIDSKQKQINTSKLESGIYYLKVKTEIGVSNQKLIIE